ncbi:MAG: KilA,/APSES-type DNA-binding domain [Bacteroidota bacterium]|nr:KilA,/APSES-type DNA-binding domain [Bacteroidota bacterium]
MAKSKTISVKGSEITIIQANQADYISLTDMVKGFGDDTMIYSWMRNRNTLELLGIWEEMNNPGFKGLEFETFKIRER